MPGGMPGALPEMLLDALSAREPTRTSELLLVDLFSLSERFRGEIHRYDAPVPASTSTPMTAAHINRLLNGIPPLADAPASEEPVTGAMNR